MSTVRWNSAPTRSILLTKQIRGTLYLSAWRRRSGLGLDPADGVEHGHRAVEQLRERSTSTVKSTRAGRVDQVDPGRASGWWSRPR